MRVAACTLTLLLAVTAAPGAAAAATASEAPQVARLSSASDAQEASSQARALRREVAGLLQRYLDEYGGRFTAAELQQLEGYKANADRQLAAVVLAANRVTYLTSKKASTNQVASAVSRATATWKRARSTAESTWDDARRVMEPQLSLLEKVGAANDYNAMMDRFDALGERIRAVR